MYHWSSKIWKIVRPPFLLTSNLWNKKKRQGKKDKKPKTPLARAQAGFASTRTDLQIWESLHRMLTEVEWFHCWLFNYSRVYKAPKEKQKGRQPNANASVPPISNLPPPLPTSWVDAIIFRSSILKLKSWSAYLLRYETFFVCLAPVAPGEESMNPKPSLGSTMLISEKSTKKAKKQKRESEIYPPGRFIFFDLSFLF